MPVELAVFLTACIGVMIALDIALGGSYLPVGKLQSSVFGVAILLGVASTITGVVAILMQIWGEVA